MARTVTAQRKNFKYCPFLDIGYYYFLPNFLDSGSLIQNRGGCNSNSDRGINKCLDVGELFDCSRKIRLLKTFHKLGNNCSWLNGTRYYNWRACSMVDGVRPIKTYQRYFDVDALNKDASCGRRSLPYLSDIY